MCAKLLLQPTIHARWLMTSFHPYTNKSNATGSQKKVSFAPPGEISIESSRALLWKWIGKGKQSFLFMDVNQYVLWGKLNHMLAEEGIVMHKAIIGQSDLLVTLMFKQENRMGQVPINGCWVTPEIDLLNGTWLAFYYKCPRDHHSVPHHWH